MGYYVYEGPVINNFGKIISNKWKGETYAVSDKKAVSNLSSQFKRKYGLLQSAKITLVNSPIEMILQEA